MKRQHLRSVSGWLAGATAVLAAVALSACAVSGPATTTASAASPASAASGASAPAATPTVDLPPVGGQVDYQLGGSSPLPDGVTIVARDSTDKPADGAYSICYVNGFQTQPEAKKSWLKNHPKLVLMRKGKPVIDPNWPGEMILNTSTAAKRAAIAKVFAKTIKGCATAGFEGVEFDNLDTFTRSKKLLTAGDNRAMAKLYVAAAHKAGLAAGQKNTAELAAKLKKTAKFDFAVAEECYRWDECAAYSAVYGDHVIDIEYADDLRGTFADACADPDSPASMVLRDRDLVTSNKPEYVYEAC